MLALNMASRRFEGTTAVRDQYRRGMTQPMLSMSPADEDNSGFSSSTSPRVPLSSFFRVFTKHPELFSIFPKNACGKEAEDRHAREIGSAKDLFFNKYQFGVFDDAELARHEAAFQALVQDLTNEELPHKKRDLQQQHIKNHIAVTRVASTLLLTPAVLAFIVDYLNGPCDAVLDACVAASWGLHKTYWVLGIAAAFQFYRLVVLNKLACDLAYPAEVSAGMQCLKDGGKICASIWGEAVVLGQRIYEVVRWTDEGQMIMKEDVPAGARQLTREGSGLARQLTRQGSGFLGAVAQETGRGLSVREGVGKVGEGARWVTGWVGGKVGEGCGKVGEGWENVKAWCGRRRSSTKRSEGAGSSGEEGAAMDTGGDSGSDETAGLELNEPRSANEGSSLRKRVRRDPEASGARLEVMQ